MSKKNTIIAFFLLFLVVFAPLKSFASQNDFEDSEMFSEDSTKILTKEAKLIVKGEVKNIKLTKGINDITYARASVLVDEFIKGKLSKKNILVEYRVGEMDNSSLPTEENLNFEQGEEVILFLTNSFWRKNIYYIIGGASGKYAVCDDDTIKTGTPCDENNELGNNDEEFSEAKNIDSEEILAETETKPIENKKQTLEDLLGEIKNAK